MTTEKRKQQIRIAVRKNRAEKKREGRVAFNYQIFPEWRKRITAFIKNLEKEV